jgi:hypothetical protein
MGDFKPWKRLNIPGTFIENGADEIDYIQTAFLTAFGS